MVEIIFKVTVLTSEVTKITFGVALITFKVAGINSSVAKITFEVAEIKFKCGCDHLFSGQDLLWPRYFFQWLQGRIQGGGLGV